ncbi:MAG: class I SAM-dependent methyltransferase [Methylococcaceae bacterium]|jgi:hypothetical protein
MKDCPICFGELSKAFTATVLQKYEVSYYHCKTCGFVRSERPYWLDEAYSAAIAKTDTGLVSRNLALAKKLAILLYCYYPNDAAFLDYAGGYGLLTRLMRDNGFNFFWDDKFCQNLLASGFEADTAKQRFQAVTGFEVIEHVHDPVSFVKDVLEKSGCRTFIFSTQLYSGEIPPAPDWWYYAFDEGQHIAFFQFKTLAKLAEKLGLKFYSKNGIHILTDRKLQHSGIALLWAMKLSAVISPIIKWRLGSLTMIDHGKLMHDKHAE